MQVSVIIPTLNEATEISACIESARVAGASEVIVADGGSVDETLAVARQDADNVLSTPAGRAAQQNAGAAHATGDVLLFLHADNRLSSDCMAQIAAVVDEHGQDICGGFCQCIDDDDWKYRWVEHGNAARASRLGWVYGDQAIFVSRDWFRSLGGFPNWPIMEDVEMMRRLKKSAMSNNANAPNPLLLPGPVYVNPRRWHQSGLVRQTVRNWTMLLAWRCGISPETLTTFYPPCPTPSAGETN